ncbi:MAG: hypothetical protein HY429_01330 [Candidatus Levybacteria bacterium]|nr:hypothetical protein [Candidatus Levybacteria bacterium]
MKYIALLVLAFGIVFYFGLKANQSLPLQPSATDIPTPSQSPVQKATSAIFVPYWSFTRTTNADEFDQVFYFGIAVDETGVNTQEIGYKKLAQFASTIPKEKETLLVVRMIDQENNFAVLKNPKVQEEIINQTTTLAKQYSFEGIALDLEVSSLPFESITKQITTFTKLFYDKAKKENLQFNVLLYGDTFSKIRPYDVVELRNYTDHILLMAYDFHKANGNPGPNFPFSGKETYGYDFQTMVTDFLNLVPKEKLGVVFGMFGYDWIVDDQNESVGLATSLSLNQMQRRFVDGCNFSDCSAVRDSTSAEMKVEYIDQSGKKHVVWFEDKESYLKKKEFLEQKGITNISFWAYSYF